MNSDNPVMKRCKRMVAEYKGSYSIIEWDSMWVIVDDYEREHCYPSARIEHREEYPSARKENSVAFALVQQGDDGCTSSVVAVSTNWSHLHVLGNDIMATEDVECFIRDATAVEVIQAEQRSQIAHDSLHWERE